jgi:hypothetical protein
MKNFTSATSLWFHCKTCGHSVRFSNKSRKGVWKKHWTLFVQNFLDEHHANCDVEVQAISACSPTAEATDLSPVQ